MNCIVLGVTESDTPERLSFTDPGIRGFPGGTVLANAGDARDMGSVLRSRRSPEAENDNPLPYSCLGNPMDRGSWYATVLGDSKIQT